MGSIEWFRGHLVGAKAHAHLHARTHTTHVYIHRCTHTCMMHTWHAFIVHGLHLVHTVGLAAEQGHRARHQARTQVDGLLSGDKEEEGGRGARRRSGGGGEEFNHDLRRR